MAVDKTFVTKLDDIKREWFVVDAEGQRFPWRVACQHWFWITTGNVLVVQLHCYLTPRSFRICRD